MALKIPIPGIDFSVNVPEKPDNSTHQAEQQPVRLAVRINKEVLAREQISAIEVQAIALGWERDQLDELGRCMKVYMPNCRIGEVRLNAIQVIHLYHDGTIRNYSNFYNMRTEQPWIKKVDRPPTG